MYAWQVSDQLLRLNHSLESSYFAAQTMRTKVTPGMDGLVSEKLIKLGVYYMFVHYVNALVFNVSAIERIWCLRHKDIWKL